MYTYTHLTHKSNHIAATFGSFLIPITYLTCRELRISVLGSITAAVLVTFDMLNVTEARLILTDSQLMFYIGLSLYIAVRFWKRRNW